MRGSKGIKPAEDKGCVYVFGSVVCIQELLINLEGIPGRQ